MDMSVKFDAFAKRPAQGTWNEVVGSGGGGGSSKKGGDAPNSLFSKGIAQVLDLIGEGPIQGLNDGAKSIFMNNVPFEGATGQTNFTGVSWAIVYGYPDQPYIPGFVSVTQPMPAFNEARVSISVGPVVNRITDTNADAATVTINCPALVDARHSSGAKGTGVQLMISVAANAGSSSVFVDAVPVFISGKTSSSYSEDYRLNLSSFGNGPWDIKVTRITPDSTVDALQNQTYLSDIQVVYDHKFSYPNSAMVGTSVDAQYFGTSAPTRSYDILGLIISVPTNYNPVTRHYTGLWDGTFKQAWTNNPAWVFYDLVTNTRYGLGISPAHIDKWGLYTIAQYCDGVDENGNLTVSDGLGGTEPRFTYNGVIKDRVAAFDVLNSLASTFRGMVYWSAGQVSLTQDAPRDALKIFTAANVIDGNFEYSGSSKLARHSVYVVQWTNPKNSYLPDFEVVEDPVAIRQVGYNPKNVTAFGCTSRGQARRFGRWALAAESLQLDMVKFTAGFDAADLMPGNIFDIADPAYAGVRMGGRVLSVASNGSSLTIDMPYTFVNGHEYEIGVILQDGSLLTGQVANTAGTTNVVQLVADIPLPTENLPIVGAIYTLIDINSVEPRKFQCLSNTEKNNGTQWEIIALEQNSAKFSIADNGASFDNAVANKFQNLPNVNFCPPPQSVAVRYETLTDIAGNAQPTLHLSWLPPSDYPNIQGYVAGYKLNDDNWVMLPLTGSTAVDITNPGVGSFQLRVNAINTFGITSAPVYLDYDITQNSSSSLDLISSLATALGGGSFTGADCVVSWKAAPISNPTATPGNGVDAYFNGFRVRVYNSNGGTVLRTEYVNALTYTYDVSKNQADGAGRNFQIGVSTRGADGSFSNEVKLVCSNPYPVVSDATPVYDSGNMRLTFTQPSDPDYAGVCMWVSQTSGFTPGSGNIVYQGNGQPWTAILPDTDYYVRWQFFDLFGTAGCPISTEQHVRTPVYQEAIDRTNAINSAFATLNTSLSATNASISVVAAQVATLAGDAPVYDSSKTYADGNVVKGGDGVLYAAKQAVPVSEPPPNTTYWEWVGNYASVGDALSGLSISNTTLTSSVSTINGALTSEIASRSALEAQVTGGYSGTDPTALTTGLVYNMRSSLVSADSANTTSINSVSAVLTALGGTVSGQGSAISSLQSDVSTLNGNVSSNSSAITGLQSSLTTTNSNVSGNSSAISSLNSSVSTLNGQVSSNSSAITGIQSSLTTTNSNVSANASSISSLNSSVSTLNGQVSSNSSSISTLTSNVNGLSSTVTTLGTTQSSQAGDISTLKAKWSVTLDVNGYVTGIYQESTGTSSSFQIIASNFSIKGPGGTAFTPFTVDTTNNIVKMTNVYIDSLVAGSVTTPSLANNAATAIASSTFSGPVTGYSAFYASNYFSITIAVDAWVFVDATVIQGFHAGSGWTWASKVLLNGTTQPGSIVSGTVQNSSISLKNAQYLSAGTYNIELDWQGDSNMSLDQTAVFVVAYLKTT